MKKNVLFSAVLLFSVVVLNSCKKDPVVDPNEGELITTVRLKLSNTLSGSAVPLIFEFKDLDGEGGAAPVKFDDIVLQKNIPYICEVTVLNESVSPADDITKEIKAEANDHQFYYVPSNPSLLSVSNYDTDTQGLPLGLSSFWVTGINPGSGTVKIVLKHKPGTKAANDIITKGETDIELDFKLIVQ
jgi:hypothetical protein